MTAMGIHREVGIFGKVEGYIGTVEAQGCGTLHLHIILWLCGSPTSKEMKDLLATESFRHRVATFISSNIRTYHHELTSDTMHDIPRE